MRSSLWLFLPALSFSLAAGAQEANEGVVPRVRIVAKDTMQSMLFETRDIEIGDNRARITSLEIIPGLHELHLALPQEAGEGSTLSRFRFDGKALAAFTGSFLETFAPATPAGLVSQGKRVVSELLPNDKVMTAVVCYSDDLRAPVVIADAATFITNHQTKGDCVQTGPFLIKNGRNEFGLDMLDKNLRFSFAELQVDRAFLLIDSQGNIYVGVTSSYITFVSARRSTSVEARERLRSGNSSRAFRGSNCGTSLLAIKSMGRSRWVVSRYCILTL